MLEAGLASRALTGTRIDDSCGVGEVGGVKRGGVNRNFTRKPYEFRKVESPPSKGT